MEINNPTQPVDNMTEEVQEELEEEEDDEIGEIEGVEISLDEINETLQKIVAVLERIEQKMK